LTPQEFYIPTESSSVHFLKSKLCVGCTKGFEIVDLETLDTQGLLDPADSSLDFVQKRENAKPIAIYRIDGEFLLCYDGEFCTHFLSRPKLAAYASTSRRVCLLRQQERMASEAELDHPVGGLPVRLR
jgi:hypothetical protein